MIEINFYIILVQIITFCAAIFILWKMFWKPLVNFMEKRRNGIEEDIRSAKLKQAEAEKFVQQYRCKLEGLNQEARLLFEKITKQAELNSDKIISDARAEAKRILDDAIAEIGIEKEKAKQALMNDISGLGVLIAEKLVKQSVDKNTQSRLEHEFFEGLKNGKRHIV
jgi:F-type H+-transporting ATPase subunit b